MVTVNGRPCARVNSFPFLVQSNCRYPPDALVSRTSFSGGSRTRTRGETLSSKASPVCNAKANNYTIEFFLVPLIGKISLLK